MKLIFELIEPKQNLYMAKGKNEGFAVSKKEISAEVNIRNNKRKQNTHIMRGFRVWVKNQPTTTKHTAHNTKKKAESDDTQWWNDRRFAARPETHHTHTQSKVRFCSTGIISNDFPSICELYSHSHPPIYLSGSDHAPFSHPTEMSSVKLANWSQSHNHNLLKSHKSIRNKTKY